MPWPVWLPLQTDSKPRWQTQPLIVAATILLLYRIGEFKDAGSCMLPMGVTSENVAAKYNVTRKTQDEFAVKSHRKAAAAQVGWLRLWV